MDSTVKLAQCLDSVRQKIDFSPRIGLVLGSGLGEFGESIDIQAALSYQDIEGFPVSTVDGHRGRFLFGLLKGIPIVAMQGRVHYYEGYSMHDVVLPIRLMGLLGIHSLLLTNAAGGINFDFQPGNFMLITDQITSFVPSPLIGANMTSLGPRFPDMSAVYDRALCDQVRQAAKDADIPLKEGVYIQFTGPHFESPAEIRMARMLGADAVGMSTACEAVAAHHMGLRVCGISCISNLGCGMTDQPLSAQEVDETAGMAAPLFRKLVTRTIARMDLMQSN